MLRGAIAESPLVCGQVSYRNVEHGPRWTDGAKFKVLAYYGSVSSLSSWSIEKEQNRASGHDAALMRHSAPLYPVEKMLVQPVYLGWANAPTGQAQPVHSLQVPRLNERS